MDTVFQSSNPQAKARPVLDEVLEFGTDQVAIACAFCTAAGVGVLLKHVDRLKRPGSSVVIAAEPPTDYRALNLLYEKIGKNLLIHWGSLAPNEKKLGAPLMHSKVFYARAGGRCRVWTGSHNLTASATQGLNCEAAVIVSGDTQEQFFADAFAHLKACKDQAVPYDPDLEFAIGMEDNILVIHAEAAFIPTKPLPWHVHLCLNSEDCDSLLDAPAGVRLYLYNLGRLTSGIASAKPLAAYRGALTGVNFTAQNAAVRSLGMPAEFKAADFEISDKNGILNFHDTEPLDAAVTTQAPLYIEALQRATEVLLTKRPRIERVFEHADRQVSLDSDMREFFAKSDEDPGGSILQKVIVSANQVVTLEPRKGIREMPPEIGRPGVPRLEMRIKPQTEEGVSGPEDLLERIKWRLEGER